MTIITELADGRTEIVTMARQVVHGQRYGL